MTHARSISSRVWIARSVWPSIYGWKAVLNFSLVLIALWTLLQNANVKQLSLSKMIDIGTPWSRTISFTYKSANCSSEYVILIGKKCADLVNLSTITHTTSCPLVVLGKPTTKSMEICSHFHSGISIGCRTPAGRWCSALIFWQTRHFSTNRLGSAIIL